MKIYYRARLKGNLILTREDQNVDISSISEKGEGFDVASDIRTIMVKEGIDEIELRTLKGNIVVLDDSILVGFTKVLSEEELEELKEKFDEFLFMINTKYSIYNPIIKQSYLFKINDFTITVFK